MVLNHQAANSIAAALPSCRVALLFGAVLALPTNVVLAAFLFAATCLSFVASLVLATKVYRTRLPRQLSRSNRATPARDERCLNQSHAPAAAAARAGRTPSS